MKMSKYLAAALAFVAFGAHGAAKPTGITCDDLRVWLEPTPEALERFAELRGSCEGVVERNGKLYMMTTAIVRRSGNVTTTLYLPSTDHTFDVTPRPESRVILSGLKVRPRDLQRGQEINIYLPVDEFTQPRFYQVVMVTVEDVMVEHDMEPVSALPSTASWWPAIALCGLVLLGMGIVMRPLRAV